jgi:CBS domain-containing protein
VISEQVKPTVSATLALQVPNWCLVNREGEDLFLVNGTDLMDWLEETSNADQEQPLIRNVTESSLRRWTIAVVPEQATLRQVLDILKARTVEAVCVYTRGRKGQRSLRGIVTRDRIERFTLDHLNA